MTDERVEAVHIIGGGLAGSEAAWQIAQAGVAVVLHEMRPVRQTDAHQTGAFAELVGEGFRRARDGRWQEQAEVSVSNHTRVLLLRGSGLPGEPAPGREGAHRRIAQGRARVRCAAHAR